MQGMREIKRRIRSVKNTQQITKSFKMVSASKLRRAQERAEQARPYVAKMAEVLANIGRSATNIQHPMLEKRPVKKTGYIVIASDRGLAGGYNSNVVRKAEAEFRKHQSQDEYAIFAVGRKAVDYFKHRGYSLVGEIIGVTDYPMLTDLKSITSGAVGMYADGTFDELYIVYNEFITAVTQRPVVQLLLPLDGIDGGEDTSAGETEYIYDPSAEEVLGALLPKYAETLIFNAVLNAKASEHGARMTAMSNATDNASEMIKTLSLRYNRARQAAITQEISEIVAGANALS